MHYYPFLDHLEPIVLESLLVELSLAAPPVEVGWQVPLARFRAFYTLVRDWNLII
jgi:hypothetical protein